MFTRPDIKNKKDYEDFLEFIKENDNGLDEEGEQICKIRSEYKLPCRNCIKFEVCKKEEKKW